MEVKSEKEKYCSKTYSRRQHRCWECQSLAKRNIQTVVMDKPGATYDKHPNHNWTEVISEEIYKKENGMTYYKYKVWDGNYVMNFGHFCKAECGLIYANKEVLRRRKAYGSSKNTVSNLDTAVKKLAKKYNTKK